MSDSIEHYKSEAKHLLKDYKNGDTEAIERVSAVLRDTHDVTLQRVQHVIAKESECSDWRRLINACRALDTVMLIVPCLTHFGIGNYMEYTKSPEENERELAKGRRILQQYIGTILWTIEWLKDNIKPIKTINTRHTSYGLKHMAEYSPNGRYMYNGVFIAGAILAGYRYRIHRDSPNPSFGMSEQSISELRYRENARRRDRSTALMEF